MNRSSTPENPSLLAIEASTEQCSVALLVNGKITSDVCNTPRSHAKVLLPMIDALLNASAISLQDLDALAIGIGPGSFTGIRIGVGVAQGLAYGAQLPVYTRASLDILAYQAATKFPACQQVVASLDARMDELYWGRYAVERAEGESPNIRLVGEIAANGIRDFNEALANDANDLNEHSVGVGHGWRVDGVQRDSVAQIEEGLLPSAEALVNMCLQDMNNGRAKLQGFDSVLEPLYVRNEVAWEKRVRIRTTTS